MPFSDEPSDTMLGVNCSPTMPPPNSLTESPTPISFMARTMATESFG